MSFITESVIMEVEAIRVSAVVTARKEEGPGVGIPTTLKAVRGQRWKRRSRGNLAHGRWGALSGGAQHAWLEVDVTGRWGREMMTAVGGPQSLRFEMGISEGGQRPRHREPCKCLTLLRRKSKLLPWLTEHVITWVLRQVQPHFSLPVLLLTLLPTCCAFVHKHAGLCPPSPFYLESPPFALYHQAP